ncbi:MAG: hypothetical protein M3065_13385 [Actinomycetota bacterium]|nr:hypothetical protein [Actinomycetota bacterium]
MGYRQYTHCVRPADYVDNTPPDGFGNILLQAANPLNVAKWVATACDYLLGGKLVCLGDGSDQCAIGHITHFEPASAKSFPSNLDNDFSFNVLLAPHALGEVSNQQYLTNYNVVANDGLQGYLMQEQSDMPMPHDAGNPADDSPPPPIPSPRYQGYATVYPDSNYLDYDPSQSPFQVPGSDGYQFYVPSFHMECEGSRANDVCAAIAAVQGPASAVCDIPIIGWLACLIVDIALAPILAIAIAIAWATAVDGSAADPQVGGGGTLALGDLIIGEGRWVYDAGHQGWNEFHPLKRLQLIPPEASDWRTGFPDFLSWYQSWCGATAACPPYAPPGSVPTDMTSVQQQTHENQRDPRNQWIFHPLVDGCDASAQPPRPPPVR